MDGARRFLDHWYPGVQIPEKHMWMYQPDRAVALIRVIGDTEVQVCALVVHPQLRNKGLGTRIVQTIQKRWNVVWANVLFRDEFTRLKAFWEHLGFHSREITPDANAMVFRWSRIEVLE